MTDSKEIIVLETGNFLKKGSRFRYILLEMLLRRSATCHKLNFFITSLPSKYLLHDIAVMSDFKSRTDI